MILFLILVKQSKAVEIHHYVSYSKIANGFPLFNEGKAASLLSDENDWQGVQIAFKNFRKDLQQVTGAEASWNHELDQSQPLVVIAGTIGRNKWIDQLIKAGKINVDPIKGKWEASITCMVDHPFKGVEKALVIVGSDKRGAIYGIYTLSAQIGVSPWYWWADVPVVKHTTLYVQAGNHLIKEPSVKYRGIFLNDEAPALTGWAKEKFGGLNHQFYQKVFELILRLKGNYLWPAMWGNAFNVDDKLNPVLADEYGIVMGTSHHEPMMRSQQEWKRYGHGDWNYQTNDSTLRAFWKKGIENMGNHESIVTMAMRGDGDMPMSEGSNVSLLERIVHDQREIIENVTGKKASETPQLWALYKEVQDYYDKGMRVPDDITLLFSDDNWGNIRRLPSLKAAPRSGGYGIYYHFDYVGGPRNYKWLNTNQISKIWEQLHLANQYGANQIWIANVGDLKPMEFPIEFFLDYAFDSSQWSVENLPNYTKQWAEEQFGAKYVSQIAQILSEYTRFNARRKPELLSPTTYSLVNYHEFENVVKDYQNTVKKAKEIENQLPKEYRDAYFELVLHPVLACANLNQLYYKVALNRWYAQQGRSATNDMAEQVDSLFKMDKHISEIYNKEIAQGKWNHMMDQTHISYVSWNDPKVDVMPEVKTLQIPDKAHMGVYVEGDEKDLANEPTDANATLQFNFNEAEHYIEIFNKGKASFNYQIKNSAPWVLIRKKSGEIKQQERINLKIDWKKLSEGTHSTSLEVIGADTRYQINLVANKAPVAEANSKNFIADGASLGLEAGAFTRAIPQKNWKVIPDYGRTLSGVTYFPVIQPSEEWSNQSPHLDYEFNLQDTTTLNTTLYLSPTLDFLHRGGLRFGVSFDDEQPVILKLDDPTKPGWIWNKNVSDAVVEFPVVHHFDKAGKHQLKFWRIDPDVVIQKIDLNSGKIRKSYLGVPSN